MTDSDCVEIEPDRRQKLRIFFSADLVGSTEFKSRNIDCVDYKTGKPSEDWSSVFLDFYSMFVDEFHKQCNNAEKYIKSACELRLKSDKSLHLDKIEVWKAIGDEILFTDIVDQVYSEEQLIGQVLAFIDTIYKINNDQYFNQHNLGVKGAVWTAGFPIRNKEVRFHMGEHCYAVIEHDDLRNHNDQDTGNNVLLAGTCFHDYVGPEIDAGFRISRHTSRGRIVVSLDTADFLTRSNFLHPICIRHVGWRILKGSYSERPYPIFWVSRDGEKIRRSEEWDQPWKGWPDELEQNYFTNNPMGPHNVAKFIKAYRDRMQDIGLIKPYASPGKATACHIDAHKKNAVKQIRDIICGGASGGFKMLPIDELHRVKKEIIYDPEERQAAMLNASRIINHEKYKAWLEDKEFIAPFMIPEDIGRGDQAIKWSMDKLRIIKGNELQVKLTELRGKILMTDGLWVPGLHRVFPFTDESERLLDYIEKQEGLLTWPDMVVDPATGCGHHIVAMSHVPLKIAADISARAVSFCDINCILNEVTNVSISINDIKKGIPVACPRDFSGKILFMINMPFALEPAKDILPMTARGGETGAKWTFAALEALSKFADENAGKAKMRAVVLNYSVGNTKENRWEIWEKAKELFGQSNVGFSLFKDEKMWRVNGKKEQPVPMPVDKIILKANCKYYVTDQYRQEAREGYERLIARLKTEWDVVGYGILDIKINC